MTTSVFNPTHAIVIGNGFDLSLGLKTGYTDFIASTQFEQLLKTGNKIAIMLTQQLSLKNWVDVEAELAAISMKSAHPDREFKSWYEELREQLMVYLRTIDNAKLDGTTHAYQMLRRLINEQSDYVIFNFNYTSTVDRILQNLDVSDDDRKLRHWQVHGSLRSKDIVFGVSDAAKVRSHREGGHIFLHKAFSLKPLPFAIEDRFAICKKIWFFGHSLGDMDSMYFNKIFNAHHNQHAELVMYRYGEIGQLTMWARLKELSGGGLTPLRRRMTEIDTLTP